MTKKIRECKRFYQQFYQQIVNNSDHKHKFCVNGSYFKISEIQDFATLFD